MPAIFSPSSRIQKRSSGIDWKSFDSLNLQKLQGDRFRAEILYLDQYGKPQKHSFEGTREEIRNHIAEEKDLPDNEREQLLEGLETHPHVALPFLGSPFEWPDPFRDF